MRRPRFWFDASWFSQDSATTYSPAMHIPLTNRIAIQAGALSVRPTMIIVADSMDASAA